MKKKEKMVEDIYAECALDINDPRFYREDKEEQERMRLIVEDFNRHIRKEAECIMFSS